MTELDPSARRLDAALKRLEGALDSLMSRTGDPAEASEALGAAIEEVRAALGKDGARTSGELE